MSRIGKQPIILESSVTSEVVGNILHIEGPKGRLDLKVPVELRVVIQQNQIEIISDNRLNKSIHGLFRSLTSNAAVGVTKLWTKTLELVGVGYRGETSGKELILNLGFANPVKITSPDNITFSLVGNKIIVSGVDKYLVGETAARIRSIKKPEPYKGKGIRYVGERIRKKLGKAAKAVGTAGPK